jgi:4-alpha-glucanotransferase
MRKQDSDKIERGAGVLMPISSLPGPYGIGTLGNEAYDFADFAFDCGFKYWQVLPVGPTSFGDSPYQSFSAFAGNPYFIAPDILMNEKLIDKNDIEKYKSAGRQDDIDYEALYNSRYKLLRSAYEKADLKQKQEYMEFENSNSYWLNDYALFMALKFHFGGKSWTDWDEDIKKRTQESVKHYSELLSDEIGFYKFLQYEFRKQWQKLKDKVNANGQYFIGDIPLYVAMDSADVWVHKELFELDGDCNPINIAGVPPDCFSQDGQRWGNPIYNWKAMGKDGFSWWRQRMKANAGLYDVIRIDHFIGIVNYWSIPASSPTAVDGEWVKGPGSRLTDAIIESVGSSAVIAEDLGVLTKPVRDLIKETNFPGMKVIEFGLDCKPDNPNLPHNYSSCNMVAYIGTHDNEPIAGYLKNMSVPDIEKACDFFDAPSPSEIIDMLMKSLFSSIANIVVVQLQDMLRLDDKSRMNTPSTLGENWRWRVKREQYHLINTAYYRKLVDKYNRSIHVAEQEKEINFLVPERHKMGKDTGLAFQNGDKDECI